MKKSALIIGLTYGAAALVYGIISLMFIFEKNTAFWTGLLMVVFSCVLSAVITAWASKKRDCAFPLTISVNVFCGIYVLAVIISNILIGIIFKAGTAPLITAQIICFAVFAVITAVLLIVKRHISEQSIIENDKSNELKKIIFECENIKNKLIKLPAEQQKKALAVINSIIEELRFSDLSVSPDILEMDEKISSLIGLLSSETDNLIEIQADDITSFEESANDIKALIKERNARIKLLMNINSKI